jgi:hypothetical protein
MRKFMIPTLVLAFAVGRLAQAGLLGDYITGSLHKQGARVFHEGPVEVVDPGAEESVTFRILGSPAHDTSIIYVDADAVGNNDGASWANAYNYLQDALRVATAGCEIRVAQGIYKPHQGAAVHPGGRSASFPLKKGVAIKGGYAGLGEPDPDARDFQLYETILSGDLNGDDGPEFANNTENSYHVVVAHGSVDATGVLDGFTITGGNANGPYSGQSEGAGLYTYDGSPTVRNCTFVGNCVDGDQNPGGDCAGGGMYNYEGNPFVTNCTFRENSVRGSRAARGGGLSNYEGNPTIVNCTFVGNSTEGTGSHPDAKAGGMYNYSGNPVVVNCAFIRNTTTGSGAGLWNYEGAPTVINCTFTGNEAGKQGGALWNYEGTVTVTNSVLWNNTPDEIHSYSGTLAITYSNVPAIWPGEGNISADPLLADAYGRLSADSPCIDRGNNAAVPPWVLTDLDGKPRIIGGRIDMGAYEVRYPRVIYVDDDATGANNGSSWTDAYNFLQDSLAVAWSGDEIRVAQGTYKPDHGAGITPGDRAATFQLINGVILEGGYAGFGVPDPNNRDIELYETILSGDLNGDDGPDFANTRENSYHVVSGADEAIIDGFTILGGNANGLSQSGYGIGGGLYNDNCRLVVANCTFEENAAFNGGAIFSRGGALAVHESTFLANLALQGGALVNLNGRMTLTRCVLRNNSDGTIFCFGNAALQVESCVFDDNYGGWHAIDCSSTGNVIEVVNTLFTHNAGGAINSSYNALLIVNSTLVDNHTTTFGGGVCCSYGSLSAVNCIMWGNTAGWDGDEIFGADAAMTVSYSCVAGGYPGTGNINMNPLFRAPASEDYHLLAGSPCINAGDPDYIPEPDETDLDGRPRVISGRIDMGAYEFNHIPVANAGPDQTICAWMSEMVEVTLDGTDSYDEDGQPLTYAWTWMVDGDSYTVTEPTITIELPVGEHVIELIVNDGIDDSEADRVIVTIVGPMESQVSIFPLTINRQSRQSQILAWVRLPEGVARDLVDSGQLLLLYPGGIEATRQHIFEYGRDDARQTSIFAFFDKAELMDAVPNASRVQLQVVGQFKTGQCFYGVDSVRIIGQDRQPSPRRR